VNKNLGRVLFLLILAAAASPLSFGQASKKEAANVVPDWGQFRGPKRDGISPDTGLLKEWPKGGPTLAWKASGLGAGYSSVAIAGKFLYTMGEDGGQEVIIGMNLADGKILWKAKVCASGDPGNQGQGPRATPATDGTLVIGTGHDGTMVCVRAANGQEIWRKRYSDLGAGGVPSWGFSDSPLIDGGMVACIPGGSKGTVAALNKMTGAPLWSSSQIKDGAHYTSLVTADIGGIPQYLVFTDKTVAGIAKTGQVLWKMDRPGQTAICSSPVSTKDGIVFVSSGYGRGCTAFQVSGAGGQFKAAELYDNKEMQSHHGGIVLVDGHVYGMSDNGGLKCIEVKTGKTAWNNTGPGKGAIACADGLLFCRNEGSGVVTLVEASAESYKEKGRLDQPERSKRSAWSNPVVFGGKLYLRDQDNLFCYDVKAK